MKIKLSLQSSVWRDPAIMSQSSGSITSPMARAVNLGLIHQSTPSGLQREDEMPFPGFQYVQSGISPSSTSTPRSTTSDGSGGDAKTDDGQDMSCVVCGDKSSGKHYGQYTCEGTQYVFCLSFSLPKRR